MGRRWHQVWVAYSNSHFDTPLSAHRNEVSNQGFLRFVHSRRFPGLRRRPQSGVAASPDAGAGSRGKNSPNARAPGCACIEWGVSRRNRVAFVAFPDHASGGSMSRARASRPGALGQKVGRARRARQVGFGHPGLRENTEDYSLHRQILPPASGGVPRRLPPSRPCLSGQDSPTETATSTALRVCRSPDSWPSPWDETPSD